MFDFRYHVASLAAVFLALLLGIVVGVGLSGRGLLRDTERRTYEAQIDQLERALAAAEERFPGDEIPRPEYWGGYRLTPDAIEFWEGRPNRLHELLHFLREQDGSWREERLTP